MTDTSLAESNRYAEMGRLLMYGMQRTRSPGTTGDAGIYASLVQKVLSDQAFADDFASLAAGAHFRIVGVSRAHGVVLGTDAASPFAARINDLTDKRIVQGSNERLQTEQRFVRGAIVLALVATAYPASKAEESGADPTSTEYFLTSDVIDVLKRAVEVAEASEEGDDGASHEDILLSTVAQIVRLLPEETSGKRRAPNALLDIAHQILERFEATGLVARVPVGTGGSDNEKDLMWQPLGALMLMTKDAANRVFLRKMREIAAQSRIASTGKY
jgi:hypothetical protein